MYPEEKAYSLCVLVESYLQAVFVYDPLTNSGIGETLVVFVSALLEFYFGTSYIVMSLAPSTTQ